MAIVFPASPSTNDTFTAGSITYKWDGAKWIGLGVTPADRLVEGSNSLEITAGNDLVWTGDNIGINDTSPDNKLHITTTSSSAYSTNTTNTSNLTNALLKLQNLDGGDGTGVNNYVGIQFSVASGATSVAQLQYVRTGDNSGKFEFKARNTSSSYPNIMTLLSSGNVGINRTDPDQKLNVNGNIELNAYDSAGGAGGYNTSSGLIIGNLYDAGKSYTGSDDRTACIWQERGLDLDFATNNSLQMKLTYEGKVLMGGIASPLTDIPGIQMYLSGGDPSLVGCKADNNPGAFVTLLKLAGYSQSGTSFRENAAILFETDSANSSGSAAGRILFRTEAANSTNGADTRMVLNQNGRVDIGDELGVTHAGFFQVINTGGGQQDNDCLSFFETNGNDWCIKTNFNTSGAHYHAHFLQEGSTRASIAGSSGQNAVFTSGSDHRLKENVVDLTDAEGIDLVKNLKPRKYNWIANRENTGEINTVNGFIAHEVEEAGIGHLVYGNGKDAVKEDGSIDVQTLDYAGMTPVLAAAIKGLISKVEDLEQRLSAASL